MPLLRRGRGEPDQEELMEKQSREQRHSQNLAAPSEQRREVDFLREILGTGAEGVDPHLDNLKSDDIPLANYTDAEVHEFKKLNRVTLKMYEDMHPPPESHLRGEWRRFLMDDPIEGFGHLNSAERLEETAFMQIVDSRLTRGRGGFQQENINKDIKVSETRDAAAESDDGGWLSR